MPALKFIHNGAAVACDLDKIDRSKLYGYIDTEVLDEHQRPCRLATLASDGRTLLPSGGVAFAYVSPNGLWRERSELKALNLEGAPIEPVVSTFKTPVTLDDRATAEDLLDHNIRMSYLLTPEGEGATFPPALLAALDSGAIFRFPFSFRGGLTADIGFMLRGLDGAVWLLVGKMAKVQFVGFEQQAALGVENETEDEEEAGEIDFGMM